MDMDSSEAAAPVAKPAPKKRASRAAAVKTEQTEYLKPKPSPHKKEGEVDVTTSVTTKGTASAQQSNGEVSEQIKEEVEETAEARVAVRMSTKDGETETLEFKPSELEVTTKAKRVCKRKLKAEAAAAAAASTEISEQTDKKVVKKRKTKEEKDAEAVPLQPRTDVATLPKKMFFGAHVSSAGGVHNSTANATHIGANAFALFLKSQRKWASPDMTSEARDGFVSNCSTAPYDAAAHILPHGSYLVNLAQKEKDKADQAYNCFLDDLQRCEKLGIKLYNFHPGNSGAHPRPEAIGRIAEQLNKAHRATSSVITVLENMAGQGNVIGSTWEDLRDIIALVEDKSRVGVCIDTCHAFAAGYDLRMAETFKDTMEKFNEVVGAEYLKALHLNDSKTPLGSNRDLHANIGTGFLGLRAFWNVANYAGFENLPMILETPIDKKGDDGKAVEDKSVWATEIKLLEKLVGADFELDEWRAEEERLQAQGKSEREKFEKQVEKKKQKTLDGMFKKSKKKSKEVDTDDEDEAGCSH